MRTYIFCIMLLLSTTTNAIGQRIISGIVRAQDGNNPVSGVSVKIKGRDIRTATDENGRFNLFYTEQDSLSLVFTHVLYKSQELALATVKEELVVYLSSITQELEEVEVFATGYNKIPKERATGAFELITSKQLNQSLSGSILDRLEGVSGTLAFDRRTAIAKENMDNNSSLRLRGLSTLMSDARPLIIVNNFPFEGELIDINPNDVESIVFLKDAAASAIWGAKSANGVIVIQMKEAKINALKSMNASVTARLGLKPDLGNSYRYIASKDFMDLEERFFLKGQYREANTVLLSPYVHLLYQRQKNLISDSEFHIKRESFLASNLLEQAHEYLYRPSSNKMTNLSFTGGGQLHSYLLSLGYDDNRSLLIGNGSSRLSLRTDNQFQITPKITAQLTVDYVSRTDKNNAVPLFDQAGLVPADKFMIYPYAAIVNTDGTGADMALSYSPFYLDEFEKDNNRNWYFNPLSELNLRNNMDKNQSLRLTSNLRYNIIDGLSVAANYRYNRSDGSTINHYDKATYYARNMINKFIQPDGALVIPDGDIRHSRTSHTLTHAVRAQIDFNKTVLNSLSLSALAGSEVSEYTSVIDPQQILYGFSVENYIGQNVFDFTKYYPIRPEGSLRIPGSDGQIFQFTDRFVSYYGLGSATWDKRYLLSGSLRWDASNLFGVKTNQKGVPLWSVGGAWLLHHERFMKSAPFSELKVRATVGENGNINKSAAAYPTAVFAVSNRTKLTEAVLNTAGNPQLRWELVRTWNTGLDWSILGSQIGGSVDVFKKNSYDLIGFKVADPTTGINPTLKGIKQLVNYGKFQNRGIDIRLYVKDIGVHELKMSADMSISKNWNKVVDYNVPALTIFDYFQYIVPAVSGKSRDVLYAFPWHGLDPMNGSPLVSDGSNLTTTYGTNVTGFDSKNLIEAGNSFPKWNGVLRSEFAYKDVSFSFLLTWKGAYQFRRSSINYQELVEGWNMHNDYYGRWQMPGDESSTYIPAIPDIVDRNRDAYYSNSTVLVEDGDYVRIQNLQLTYRLPLRSSKMQVDLTSIMENVGLIWTKNKLGLDPEYHLNYYNPPKQFTLGLRAKF